MLLTHSSVMESLGQPLHPWGLMGSTSLKPLHISAAGFTITHSFPFLEWKSATSSSFEPK